MPVQRIHISEFLQKAAEGILLDVRSPGEFQHAHIPGATSFPLFTDEERKLIGTTYKQNSREEAIKIGLDVFGPRMRKMVESVEKIISEKKDTVLNKPELFIYCWRGGMRSAAVAWLMDLYGFKVNTLAGGYKTFRNWTIQTYSAPYPFRLIGGYTGSGKTALLKALEQRGERIIDLEELAGHKGSAFGNIDMKPQPSQEMFENLLALSLAKYGRDKEGENLKGHIWLEDESQRIGLVNLPIQFWEHMRNAPVFFVEIPFEERLDNLVQEYGTLDRVKLANAVQRISKRLGGLATKNTLAFLEEGNLKEAFRILLEYYDKRYLKGLHNRDAYSALIRRVACMSVTTENAQMLTNYQPA